MLRRLIVIAFAFLIASCAGVFLLVMAALFDPATREAGLVAEQQEARVGEPAQHRLASFQRAKDRLRRDGVETYGTMKADQWAGGNADNPVDSRDNGCVGECGTTLSNNLDAISPNAFGTSYFEQGRERLTYSATAQWKPVDELTL